MSSSGLGQPASEGAANVDRPLDVDTPQATREIARREAEPPPDRAGPSTRLEQTGASTPKSTRNSDGRRLPRRLIRALPTVLVYAALAGLGYWGHEHGWRIARFSQLAGRSEPEQVAWCQQHGVPESICIACNAQLMPKGKLYGWCSKHGVAECVLDHPQLAQLQEPPANLGRDLERAAHALALRPRAENNPACKLHLRRIQFVSAAAVDKAGIDIRLVERGPIEESVPVTGQVRYDPTRVARLAARAAGIVWRVEKNVGDAVRRGELLALIDAADVGRAKAELLEAAARLDLQIKTYNRLAKLDNQGVVAGRRVLETEAARAEAEAAVRKAAQTLVNLGLPIRLDEVRQLPLDQLARRLQLLGVPSGVASQLDPWRITSNLLPLTAPRDGVVVSRDVVAGEVIDPSRTLFTVVDPSRMWLLVNVPQEDAHLVRVGQPVLFRPDGDQRDVQGAVTWISTEADLQTRTIQVRAEVPNPDGRLRDGAFGAGRIVLRREEGAIVVPSEAIHWEGCCHVAFVRDKNFLKKGSFKVFHARMVRPGVTWKNKTEVIAGLLPGEVVVTRGSGVLRAELLKGNLGAG